MGEWELFLVCHCDRNGLPANAAVLMDCENANRRARDFMAAPDIGLKKGFECSVCVLKDIAEQSGKMRKEDQPFSQLRNLFNRIEVVMEIPQHF